MQCSTRKAMTRMFLYSNISCCLNSWRVWEGRGMGHEEKRGEGKGWVLHVPKNLCSCYRSIGLLCRYNCRWRGTTAGISTSLHEQCMHML
jgi:hypothetical protein